MSEHQIVSYVGTTIILDAPRMTVGWPYPVVYRGELAWAIKQADGAVEFSRTLAHHATPQAGEEQP